MIQMHAYGSMADLFAPHAVVFQAFAQLAIRTSVFHALVVAVNGQQIFFPCG